MKKITLSTPLLGKEEEKAVIQVMRSGQLAMGEQTQIFEKMFAEFIGTRYAVAVSNGSIALYLALLAVGVKKNDEVITTPFSFIATANAILLTGATPVFVDIDEKTYTINPLLIEEKITPHTKAILPVHLYGLPANMKAITKIARKHGLAVIEDAAQAHGAVIGNKKVGAWGDVGCFSFYATKNMTTGEGGIITTNRKRIADKIKLLRNHGFKTNYEYELFGFNYRMTDIAAAIGIEQLKKLPLFTKSRLRNANTLSKALISMDKINVPYIPAGYTHVFHQYTVRLLAKNKITRAAFIQAMNEKKISTGIFYAVPIHKTKIYKHVAYSLPVAEKVSKEVVSIPVRSSLSLGDIKKIVAAIRSFFASS